MTHMHPPSIFPFFLITTLLISHHLKCEARDTINATTQLHDNGETLVSSESIFELGFFSPQGNNRSRYVGVWYKLIPTTIVWVANRDNPLSDSCGSFGIAEDGSLKVWCDGKAIVTFTAANLLNPTLQLLNSGNLILVDGKSVTPLWQSFSYPTDTFLPGMELNGDVKLTSWKSTTDPATGDYTFRKDHEEYVIQKRSVVHWRSGEPGSFQTSDGLPVLVNQLLSNSSRNDTTHKSYYNITKAISFNNNSRLVMNYSGEIQYYSLSEDNSWSLVWLEPRNGCSVYNACGKFGVCELKKEPMCSCPDGFKPTSLEGCDREEPTNCSQKYIFLKILVMKVGGQRTPFDTKTEKACEEECINNCECEAYLYSDVNRSDRGGTGESAPKCWIWTDKLENLQQDNVDGRYNLSLRVNTGSRLVNPPTQRYLRASPGKDL